MPIVRPRRPGPAPQRRARGVGGTRRLRGAVNRAKVIASVLIASCLLGTPLAASPALAAPSPILITESAPAQVPAVDIQSITPAVLTPTSTLTITAKVTNTTDTTLYSASILLALRTTGPITDRAQLGTDTPEGQCTGTNCVYFAGATQLGPDSASAAPIEPGASTTLSLTVPAAANDPTTGAPGLGLRDTGVHLAAVLLRNGTRDIGTYQWTSLPFEAAPLTPIPTDSIWALSAPIARDANGRFTDDSLAAQLEPSGRLGGIVAAATAAPIHPTLVLDPALLEAAETMSRGYHVVTGTSTIVGTGTEAASSFITALRNYVSLGRIAYTPYGDPDLTATVHADLGGFADGYADGARILSRVLGGLVSTYPIAWPADGMIDAATADALAAAGQSVLPLSGQSLLSTDPVSTLATDSGSLTVYRSDPTLDQLAAGVGTAFGSTSPAMLRQRFRAETLLLASTVPAPRGLLILPGRNSSAAMVRTAIGDLTGLDYLAPNGDLLSPTAQTLTSLPQGLLTYPSSARAAELPGDYTENLTAAHGRLADLCEVKPGCLADPVVDGISHEIRRGLAASLRTHPATRAEILADLDRTLAAQIGQIHLVASNTEFILGSRNSTIPVTIRNDSSSLAQLRVEVKSFQAELTADQTLTIEPNHQAQVTIKTDAQSTAPFKIVVQLLTPSGDPFGDPITYSARSTAYGTVALVVTFGALILLAIAVLLRGVRSLVRYRRARTAARDQSPSTAKGDA